MRLDILPEALGCRLAGSGEIEITGVATVEEGRPGHLTFLANPKYAHKVKHTRASAILPGAARGIATPSGLGQSLSRFCPRPGAVLSAAPPAAGHSPPRLGRRHAASARTPPSDLCRHGRARRIGRNAVLHPHVVIYEDADRRRFLAHSHAVVREFCRIGHRVTLQNGVVVGGDGFGFAKRADGTHDKIVQSGVTVIEDDVEIQSLTSVDRATVGETASSAARRSIAWCRSATPAWSAKTISSARRPASPAAPSWSGTCCWPDRSALRAPDHSRGRHRLRAERHRRRRAGRRPRLRLARLRRRRMAARHHRLSQTAGDLDRPRIEEKVDQ